MKKKVFVISFIFMVLVPINLSAKGLSLDIGATAMYDGLIEDFSYSQENLFDINNYSFGPDVRLKLGIFEIADLAVINQDETDNGWWQFKNLLTAGVNFKLFNFINVGAGVGPATIINFLPEEWKFEDEYGTSYNLNSFFLEPILSYKVSVDVLLKGLSVSAYYIVNSNDVSIQNIIDDGFVVKDLKPTDYNNGKVGVSLLISLL